MNGQKGRGRRAEGLPARGTAGRPGPGGDRRPVGVPFAEARAYDGWFDSAWGRHAFGVESQAVEDAAGPVDGRRVLDAGCGTGRFAASLERQGARTAGVDLDPAMLAVAASRVRGPLVVADVQHLPLGDRTFDLALAVTVCEFTADPAAVVAEMVRVTRPGGRVVVGSLNPLSPWGLRRLAQFRRPPWRGARFLGRRRLRQLGRAHGRCRLQAALFTAGPPRSGRAATLLEALGKRWAPALGAFQVLVIDRAP